MSAGGYRTPAGSGNGTPPRQNSVFVGEHWHEACHELEDRYPILRETDFFRRLEAYMVVCEVEDDAFFLSGSTWMHRTPEDLDPPITVYFTYHQRRIVLQEVVDL